MNTMNKYKNYDVILIKMAIHLWPTGFQKIFFQQGNLIDSHFEEPFVGVLWMFSTKISIISMLWKCFRDTNHIIIIKNWLGTLYITVLFVCWRSIV